MTGGGSMKNKDPFEIIFLTVMVVLFIVILMTLGADTCVELIDGSVKK